MSLSYNLGKTGERQAIEFLTQRGYVVREINWRYNNKELDVVADYNDELHVIEVKTRSHSSCQNSGNVVGRQKQRHIIKAAEYYAALNETNKNIVFDIIYILDVKPECKPEFIPDAFSPYESGKIH